jgi:hypothetical protein
MVFCKLRMALIFIHSKFLPLASWKNVDICFICSGWFLHTNPKSAIDIPWNFLFTFLFRLFLFRLIWILLCSLGWPWTHNSISASQMLGLYWDYMRALPCLAPWNFQTVSCFFCFAFVWFCYLKRLSLALLCLVDNVLGCKIWRLGG